ncbi:MAG: N-6 DNA methylase [Peptococcaceae bacterium]|nr:N-6 DNA methylase [Peptococcaceae bacterium]
MDKRTAADILGISSASINNWVKLGYLETVELQPDRIDADSVKRLKRLIEEGTVPKLRGRANKSQADSFFIPFAFAANEDRKNVIKLVEYVQSRHLSQEGVLFLLALNLALGAGKAGKAGRGAEDDRETWGTWGTWDTWDTWGTWDTQNNRGNRDRELPEGASFDEVLWTELLSFRTWLESSGVLKTCGERDWEEWRPLLFWDLPQAPDILGVVYQALTQENTKGRKGAYFTPHMVVDGIAADHGGAGKMVFDPCCGTGNFLLAFAARGAEPEELWGMDSDPVAVYLARINLLLWYRRPFVPRVYCGNSLRIQGWEEEVRGRVGCFDVVATNPPWGARVEKGDLAEARWRAGLTGGEGLGSGESFALFLALGLVCLRSGGCLSFLLPEAFLMVKRHEDIRRVLLENCWIKNIFYVGRVFHRVTSAAVRLDVVKRGAEERILEERGAEGRNPEGTLLKRRVHIDQKRFAGNEDAVFDVWTLPEDRALLDKIEGQAHRTLAGHAQWALGIVTGDNGRFLRSAAAAGAEGVICGSDVSAFSIREPSRYLVFQPEGLQQVAPEALYRAPKLVYRFIGTRPVAAYDDQGRLTLNSANCVLVGLEGFPVRAVEALFNTRLYGYIFFHRCHGLKVLRAHLERLPLPLWPAARLRGLAQMAEELGALGMSDEAERGRLLEELEHEVMGGFGMSARERERVEMWYRVESNTFKSA